MKEIKIYEIPIYLMAEKTFSQKWNVLIESLVKKTHNFDKDADRKFYLEFYFYQRLWQYNQIIGYLAIIYKDSSIWFEYYMTKSKRKRFKSNTKQFIVNRPLSGYHFYINDNTSNKQIKDKLLELIISFEKDIMKKQWYLDKNNFLDILPCLDLKNFLKI